MFESEEYTKRIWNTREDLVSRFSKKLEKKLGRSALIILEDKEEVLRRFHNWLVNNKI